MGEESLLQGRWVSSFIEAAAVFIVKEYGLPKFRRTFGNWGAEADALR